MCIVLGSHSQHVYELAHLIFTTDISKIDLRYGFWAIRGGKIGQLGNIGS